MIATIVVVLLVNVCLLIRMIIIEDEIQRIRQLIMLTQDMYHSACTTFDAIYGQYHRMYHQYTIMYDIYKSEHPNRLEEDTCDEPE